MFHEERDGFLETLVPCRFQIQSLARNVRKPRRCLVHQGVKRQNEAGTLSIMMAMAFVLCGFSTQLTSGLDGLCETILHLLSSSEPSAFSTICAAAPAAETIAGKPSFSAQLTPSLRVLAEYSAAMGHMCRQMQCRRCDLGSIEVLQMRRELRKAFAVVAGSLLITRTEIHRVGLLSLLSTPSLLRKHFETFGVDARGAAHQSLVRDVGVTLLQRLINHILLETAILIITILVAKQVRIYTGSAPRPSWLRLR